MDEKKPNNSASAYALALASYPEMAPYPNEMEYFDEILTDEHPAFPPFVILHKSSARFFTSLRSVC